MNHVFGYACVQGATVEGIPSGAKVRIKLRHDEFARVFVRTDRFIAEYSIEEYQPGKYRLGLLVSSNIFGVMP